jgi:hypothetical protein
MSAQIDQFCARSGESVIRRLPRQIDGFVRVSLRRVGRWLTA